jgi:hypothetical protein
MNTTLDKQHADFARAMLAPSRTCIAEGEVYVHHYTDCSTSYGITTASMQDIENYDHGTIKAVNGYAFIKHRASYSVYIIERIYLLSQRCKRYSVYYDTCQVTLVIYDKLFNVTHYPCQLIHDFGYYVFESMFPAYVTKRIKPEYEAVIAMHSVIDLRNRILDK